MEKREKTKTIMSANENDLDTEGTRRKESEPGACWSPSTWWLERKRTYAGWAIILRILRFAHSAAGLQHGVQL